MEWCQRMRGVFLSAELLQAAGCGLCLFGMWFVSAALHPFDVDGRHINRLEVSTLLWHLLWYVTQPSSQNRHPGHMWWCLHRLALITRSPCDTGAMRRSTRPPLIATAAAAETRADRWVHGGKVTTQSFNRTFKSLSSSCPHKPVYNSFSGISLSGDVSSFVTIVTN